MKTFEQEYNELGDWIFEKNNEYMEAIRKNPPVGKDGGLTYERQQVVKEYNRRLIKLKEKYNRGLSEHEQQWKTIHL